MTVEQVPPAAPPDVETPQLSFVERNQISPVLFLLGSLFIVFVLYQLVGGTIALLVAGSKVTRENVLLHRILTISGQVLFILIPTLGLARLLSVRLSSLFPWRMPHLGETFFASLSLLLLQQVLQIYLFFQDRIPLPEKLSKFIQPFRDMMEQMVRILVTAENLPELAFVVLVVAVVPAIVEEVLFRGLIQTGFERVTNPWKAAIIAGTIFGAFHFNPFAVVPLVGLGLFFGFLRMRSKSIVIAMTVHFLNNVTAVVVAYFKMDEELILGAPKGGEANIPGVLSQLFLFLVLFVVAFISYLRTTSHLDERRGDERT
ncbi:MAG TPA: hypothetical protein DCP63_01580 [Bacteroidetes bacterium]|nr:hypothetical protein [Bacteroidota bacterium]